MGLMSSVKKLVLGGEPAQIPSLGRNDECWCGSGMKYKRCHLAADDKKRTAMRSAGVSAPPSSMF